MDKIYENILKEIRDNIEIPGYDDKTTKQLISIALTITFHILKETAKESLKSTE